MARNGVLNTVALIRFPVPSIPTQRSSNFPLPCSPHWQCEPPTHFARALYGAIADRAAMAGRVRRDAIALRTWVHASAW